MGATCTIGFAWNLGTYIATVFATHSISGTDGHLYLAAAFGIAKAGLIWVQELVAVRSALAAKVELRAKFFSAIRSLGGEWVKGRRTSDLVLLANQRIDALDAYFARFLPSLVSTVLVTPVITLAILLQDFWSGITIICAIPLIPLFMIFIGWATQEVQQRQLDSLRTISRHFTEVLRGLTTLRVFGRLPHQPDAIAASSEQFRKRTMKVLRMSFLSGMALEVAASLSVALVAVSIGLRLIDGTLSFAPGLVALLLAPEALLPLRQVGANFHASNEGVLASGELLDIIDAGKGEAILTTSTGMVETDRFAPGTITRVSGPSGAGKTTFLTELRASLPVMDVAWMAQQTPLLPGSVLANIVGPNETDVSDQSLEKALSLAALDDVSLTALATDASSGLSGGQAQRVALARVFYRALTRKVKWLILDEPLSALDSQRSATVQASIAAFASEGMRVVLVSHQELGLPTLTLAVSDVG